MLQQTVRATRIAHGAALLLLGIVLASPVVPGGVLLVSGGLTVLSTEFEWARHLRDWLRGTFRRMRRTHG